MIKNLVTVLSSFRPNSCVFCFR